jgi:AraC-like DNA-binding protein
MPLETRPFDKIAFVSAGAGELHVDRGTVPLGEGDLVLVGAGERHRFADRPGTPMTLHVLCVDWQRLRPGAAGATAWRALRRTGARPRRVANAYQRAETVRRWRALVFEQTRRAPHWPLAMAALVDELLVALLRALPASRAPTPHPADDALGGTLAWIEHHFQEPVRIPALAAVAGMSYRSYTAHFRRTVGQTVNQRLQELRLEYARRRLVDGSSIIDAALDAGFQDLSHFYRLYRRRWGTTPGRTRR